MKQGSISRVVWLASIAAMAVATPGAMAAAQPTPKSVEFTWARETFEIDIPSGYCLPTSEQQAVANRDAAGDSQNATLAHFTRCGSWGEDYILVKSPRTLRELDITRPAFTAAIAQTMAETDALERGKQTGAADVERSSKGQISVIGQDFGYAGYDDTCAYLAGTLTVSDPEETRKVRVGSCMTLVGKRAFTVYSYDSKPDGANLDALKQRSKELALSLTKS